MFEASAHASPTDRRASLIKSGCAMRQRYSRTEPLVAATHLVAVDDERDQIRPPRGRRGQIRRHLVARDDRTDTHCAS
jgi:hypothetical protein